MFQPFNRNSSITINEESDIQISCSYVGHKKRGSFIREFIVTLNRPRKEKEVKNKQHRKSMRKRMLEPLRLDASMSEKQLKTKIYSWLGEMRYVGFPSFTPQDGKELASEIYEELIDLKNS